MPESYLHVYPQHYEHSSAQIVGNHESMTRLRSMLDEVLEKGSSEGEFMAYDGESYTIRLIVYSESNAMSMAVPYVDSSSSEKRTDVLWPHQLPNSWKGGARAPETAV